MEENEKTKDSRLAREFVVALPIELGKTDWQSLLTDILFRFYAAIYRFPVRGESSA